MIKENQCMICGSRAPLFRAKGLCLCGRCIGALGEALEEKLYPPKGR